MKSFLSFTFVLLSLSSVLQAQESVVDRFRHDEALQDSIIAVIVPQHALMSKLVGQIQKNPSLHKMLIQHLTRLLDNTSTSSGEHNHQAMMSPYAGDQKREIKSLSGAEIKGLLAGEGVGFAMPAELNHYPGPRHVLDMAERLKITSSQEQAIQQSYDRMHQQAVALGRKLIDLEKDLDRGFASSDMNTATLKQMTSEIGTLRGKLRAVHLEAHLETRAILTQEQIASYDRLRGYGTDSQ